MNYQTVCPICERKVWKDDMRQTWDCHGIPYRYVCPTCYEQVEENGYDGAYYESWDENIEEDY